MKYLVQCLTFSAFSIRFSRRLFCLIFSAWEIKLLNDPYSLIRVAAIFGPIPGAPGILSAESPAKAKTSPNLSAATPLNIANR